MPKLEVGALSVPVNAKFLHVGDGLPSAALLGVDSPSFAVVLVVCALLGAGDYFHPIGGTGSDQGGDDGDDLNTHDERVIALVDA